MSFACEGLRVQRAVHATQEHVEICDDVGQTAPHVVTWQLAPGWRIEKNRPNGFACHHADSAPVYVTLNGDGIEQTEIVKCEASPHFRERLTTPGIKITFRGTMTTIWRKAG